MRYSWIAVILSYLNIARTIYVYRKEKTILFYMCLLKKQKKHHLVHYKSHEHD